MSAIVRWLDKSILFFFIVLALCSTVSDVGGKNALVLTLALGIIRYAVQPFPLPRGTLPIGGILFFFLFLVLNSCFSLNLAHSFQILYTFAIQAIPFIIGYIFIKNQRQAYWLLGAIALSLLATDGFAIYQFIQGNDRPQGFSPNYMVFASYLVQLIPVLMVLVFRKHPIGKTMKVFMVIVLFFSVVALIVNNTRGAWIAVSITSLFFIWWNSANQKKAAYWILLIIITTTAFMGMAPNFQNRVESIFDVNYVSNAERLLIWQSTWQMTLDYPGTGVGIGNFYKLYHEKYISPQAKFANDHVHAHNVFLQFLVETGFLGLFVFVLMFSIIIVTSYRSFKKDPGNHWALAGMLVAVGFLVQGFTEYNFGHLPVMRLFWLLMAILLRPDRPQSG